MREEPKTTRQMIKEAFVHLIVKKPYLDITVTDVVKEAGVARASFYRNYSSVNDVMTDIINRVTVEISENMLTVVSGNDERKWREFLFGLFYRLPKTDYNILTQGFENAGFLLMQISAGLQELSKKLPSDTMEEKYAVYGRIGFVMNILKRWVDCGMEDPPEEMVNYMMSFILPKQD